MHVAHAPNTAHAPSPTGGPLPPVGFGPGGRVPTFLVIGAAKAGTTDLCHRLARHPDVYVAPGKEMNFFSHARRWRAGPGWYAGCFAGATTQRAVGEGSPNYTYRSVHPDVPERVASLMPDARLVYLVRHPMSRAASHWMQLVSNGTYASRPLAVSLRDEPRLLEASLYDKQLAAYRGPFPDGQILTVFFDDWLRDRDAELRRVLTHLNVDPDVPLRPADDRPQNATHESLEDKPVARVLRALPWANSIAKRLPAAVQAAGRRHLRRPCNLDHVRWDEASWDWFRERVEPDARRFLASQGRPADYWSFDYPPGGKVTRQHSPHL